MIAQHVQRSVLFDPWLKARERQNKQCAPPLPHITSLQRYFIVCYDTDVFVVSLCAGQYLNECITYGITDDQCGIYVRNTWPDKHPRISC